MKRIFIIPAVVCAALCSCNQDNVAYQETYTWGINITQDAYCEPKESNALYLETMQNVQELQKKYNGSGSFYSEDKALDKANYEIAIKAYNNSLTTFNERCKVFDNQGYYFTIKTFYHLSKGTETALKDTVWITFHLPKEIKTNRYTYGTTVEVPLSTQESDPATYSAAIPLEECGMDFEYLSAIQYDSVKVYGLTSREINTEFAFISGADASFDTKTLTLNFSGKQAELSKMTGDWYANAYLTLSSSIGIGDRTGIVTVPFTVK